MAQKTSLRAAIGGPLGLQPGRTASNDQRLAVKVMASDVDGNLARL
jgi:hypothetical protein